MPSRRIALLLVLLIVVGALAGSWLYLDSMPVRAIEVLANGQLTIEVPIMTQFVLPAIVGQTSTWTNVSLSDMEPFTFHWSSVASDGSPVHIVLREIPNPYGFEAAGDDAFVYRELFVSSMGASVPESANVWTYTWQMDYVARRMAAHNGFFERTWVEILVRPPDSLIGGSYLLPHANVSVPGPDDLVLTGIVDSLTATGPWTYERKLPDFALPKSPFRHRVAPITFGIGAAGTVSASLESTFLWGPRGDYTATMSGSGNVGITITWYWDARFGSLYPVVGRPYGG